jgi:thioredoxin 1
MRFRFYATVCVVLTAIFLAAVGLTAVTPPKARTTAASKKPMPKVVSRNVKQTAKPKAAARKAAAQKAPRALPRLLDLGADKCIPCKMMAPILEELAKQHKGKLKVEFIDVWKNPDAAKPYDIRSIPTQIFYDANGKEFFRHEGFYPKEDIVAKFKERGFKLDK